MGRDDAPLDALRRRGEAFLEEVSAEYHAAHAGLKEGAALQPIYEKHRDAYGDEAFAMALDLFKSGAGSGSDEKVAGAGNGSDEQRS